MSGLGWLSYTTCTSSSLQTTVCLMLPSLAAVVHQCLLQHVRDSPGCVLVLCHDDHAAVCCGEPLLGSVLKPSYV